MNVNSIIFFFILFNIMSCATFQEKNTCLGKFKLAGKDIYYCKTKGENLWGIYSYPDNKEIYPKTFLSINSFKKSGELIVKKEDQKFYRMNLNNLEPKEAEFKYFFQAPLFLNASNGIFVAITEDNKLFTFDDDGKVKGTFNNLDSINHTNEYGQNINRITSAIFGKVAIVRFNENGNRYYQHISRDGKLIGPKYPIDKVEVFLSEGHFHFFEKIGENLYWPILYSEFGNKFLKKPEHIKGVAFYKNFEWLESKSFHDVRNQGFKIPSIQSMLLIFNEKGKEKMIYRSVSHKSFKTWDHYVFNYTNLDKIYIKSNTPIKIFYTDLAWIKRKDVNKDGRIIDVETPYFKDQNGTYTYFTRTGRRNSGDKFEFSSKEDLLAYFDLKTKNIEKFSQAAVAESNAEKLDREMRRKALSDQVNRDAAAERAKKQAQRDFDRARIKADSQKAWGSVSNQIQNAGKEASKKAKCIKRQTQTKKDFLDKKQGWYETGGCK